jgi:tetratricopeptide (TPR) repeat protein
LPPLKKRYHEITTRRFFSTNRLGIRDSVGNIELHRSFIGHSTAIILMSELNRFRRKQIIREAEGYLELISCADEPLLRKEVRDRLATRTLETLAKLDAASRERVDALYLHGQALRIMEQHGQAIQVLAQAAELDHDNIHIWLALGWCHKRTGRLDKAIESLEEALLVDDRQAILHYNLACYWSLAKNVKWAVEYLERAFELDASYRDRVAQERDFDAIRNHPRFQELLSVIV